MNFSHQMKPFDININYFGGQNQFERGERGSPDSKVEKEKYC
jgi:hypothetical protein